MPHIRGHRMARPMARPMARGRASRGRGGLARAVNRNVRPMRRMGRGMARPMRQSGLMRSMMR